MKTRTLILRSRDNLDKLAELSWSENRTWIAEATEPLRSELLEMVIEGGLSEWVGPEEEPTLRTTPSSDPRFLERLATYLYRQFRITFELRDGKQVKRRDTSQWPRSQERFLREPAEVG